MEKANLPDVLTLEQVSTYLQLSIETVATQAVNGNLPGRKIENDWRFLKVAIDDWLRSKNGLYLLNRSGDNIVSKTPSIGEMFSQLRQLCVEEQYSLDIPDRTDRSNPVLGDE